MPCCQCQGIEEQFNRKMAARELRQYRKKGPRRTTRMLIDALKAEGIDGATLLDIGGGVGAIQHELLSAGVRGITGVDASTAYLGAAAEEGDRRGYADRVRHRHGDFVELAPEIEPEDIVTLDRVICCYPDMQALVERSTERVRKLYGVVYPRRTFWTKVGFAVINRLMRFRGSPFRAFLHEPAAVDTLVRSAGLVRRFYDTTFLWQVVVYAR
ncbi:MAG: class I SAM-dependent methyltransferase [Rhodothermales bacterium]